jgi:hypothetical protein
MERKEQPKQPVNKAGSAKKKELKTEPPISEKDEVKQAEERTKNTRHKL